MLKANRIVEYWQGFLGDLRKQEKSISQMSRAGTLKIPLRQTNAKLLGIVRAQRLLLLLCLLSSSILLDSVSAFGAADEDTALSNPKFTKPIVLHLDPDGWSQAQKLVAMNGVDNIRTYGARYETRNYLPCRGRRGFDSPPLIDAYIARSGYNFGHKFDHMDMNKWLSGNRIIELETYNIRYPNASDAKSYGGEDDYVCAILNDNVGKYLPSNQARNVHNGLDIAIGRRVLTKWTFRNRYVTPVPGKGNVKVFAGTFTYKIDSMVPIVSFPGEGTATVKMYLNPDTGRWTEDHWKQNDPSIRLLINPLEPSKATASAIEREANARSLREKTAYADDVSKQKVIQDIASQLSGKWEGEWKRGGFVNPMATNNGIFSLDLTRNGSVLTGTYNEKGGNSNISGSVDGKQIRFGYEYNDGSRRQFSGVISATGEVSGKWAQKNGSGTWKMVKKSSPAEPSNGSTKAESGKGAEKVPARAGDQAVGSDIATFDCVRSDNPRVTTTLVVDFTSSTVRSLNGFGGIRAGVGAQITDATISWRNQVTKNYGGGGVLDFAGSIDRATRNFTFKGSDNSTLIFKCQ